jgi:hypothetical protein
VVKSTRSQPLHRLGGGVALYIWTLPSSDATLFAIWKKRV